ncbi:DUF6017 domain-containing protein [Ruminococcus sp. CLA-AA-H200]|uniref:DUF6017 domain-containing protein n=2 Tax=Ruminococcus turbiniformis TaxID=2881258 RepID=A0ABS8FWY0_9FIRM|nr:DUF6017 domain-containing protein [Ruminococcus turbiniformis]
MNNNGQKRTISVLISASVKGRGENLKKIYHIEEVVLTDKGEAWRLIGELQEEMKCPMIKALFEAANPEFSGIYRVIEIERPIAEYDWHIEGEWSDRGLNNIEPPTQTVAPLTNHLCTDVANTAPVYDLIADNQEICNIKEKYGLSTDAAKLICVLFNQKQRHFDPDAGMEYVICPIREMMVWLGRKRRKIFYILDELETSNLILRIRLGTCQPNKIYLMDPFLCTCKVHKESDTVHISPSDEHQVMDMHPEAEKHPRTSDGLSTDSTCSECYENYAAHNADQHLHAHSSRARIDKLLDSTTSNNIQSSSKEVYLPTCKTSSTPVQYSRFINHTTSEPRTEVNPVTDSNQFINPLPTEGNTCNGDKGITGTGRKGNGIPVSGKASNRTKEQKAVDEYRVFENAAIEQISYDTLMSEYQNPNDKSLITEILIVLTDILAGRETESRVNGKVVPFKLLLERVQAVSIEHIRYILHCLKKLSKPARNIRKYLVACLYNAPATIESFYTTRHETWRIAYGDTVFG